jgi:energy-coupling factor transporter transmembrane protein EcfT
MPAAAIAHWHSWFAVTFAYGFWFRGMSACFALQGGFEAKNAGDWMDGGEPILVVLWCALVVIFWGGTIAAFRNADESA